MDDVRPDRRVGVDALPHRLAKARLGAFPDGAADLGQRQAADEAANALEEAEAEAEELRLGDLSDKLAEIVARLESARDGSYGTEA